MGAPSIVENLIYQDILLLEQIQGSIPEVWTTQIQKPKLPKKDGRPAFNFVPFLSVIENLATSGCTNEEIAHIIGCGPTTLYKALQDPDNLVSEALKKGKSRAKAEFRLRFFSKACSMESAAISIFYAKAVLGMREVTTFEHTGKNGQPIQVQKVKEMSDEELLAIVRSGITNGPASTSNNAEPAADPTAEPAYTGGNGHEGNGGS